MNGSHAGDAAQGLSMPFAREAPALIGALKSTPEDFVVDEILPYGPDGKGEHDWLHVEKRGVNSAWLAAQLARFAGVREVAIGFAGQKDRIGVTRQFFTVQLPGRRVDWSAFAVEGVRLLDVQRHSRKIQRGSNDGNRFEITLREIVGDRTRAQEQLATLAISGAPNYFTEQRFGHGGSNLSRARALFTGSKLDRAQRSFALSAARSAIFNAVLGARVVDGTWDRILPGEIAMLDGSNAWFKTVPDDPDLNARCARCEIHPTGPLWGSEALPLGAELASFEDDCSRSFDDLKLGLARERLDSARRTLRIRPGDLTGSFTADALQMSFTLPAGAYATAVLRQVCRPSMLPSQ